MRDINECKAEVFRRMEKGIKEKKRRRNHILSFCIPLCICLVALNVLGIPNKRLGGEMNSATGKEIYSTASTTEDSVPSVELPQNHIQVEIMDKRDFPNEYYKADDEDTVNKIYAVIQKAFFEDIINRGNDTTSVTPSGGLNMEDSSDSIDYVMNHDEYTVAFYLADGEYVVYVITEEELINETTGEKKSLTAEERKELLKQLSALIKLEEILK